MRTGIILGRQHGKKSLEMLSGPDVLVGEQLKKIKGFLAAGESEQFEHIELWTSDSGRLKTIKNIQRPKGKTNTTKATK